jgi:hypothetical protein
MGVRAEELYSPHEPDERFVSVYLTVVRNVLVVAAVELVPA